LLPELITQLRAHDVDEFYQLLGEGEITATQLSQALLRLVRPATPEMPVRKPRPAPRGAIRSTSRGSVTCPSQSPAAVHRCAHSPSSATSPWAAGSPSTVRTAATLGVCAPRGPSACCRWSGQAQIMT
jgi:hypothetical protein